MPSPRTMSGLSLATGVIALALVPVVARAECVTIQLPEGERYSGPVAKPSLIFSGTVTATDIEKYTVSFTVERVWTGELRRQTTLLVVPVVEGAQATSFHTGESYLVTAMAPATVLV